MKHRHTTIIYTLLVLPFLTSALLAQAFADSGTYADQGEWGPYVSKNVYKKVPEPVGYNYHDNGGWGLYAKHNTQGNSDATNDDSQSSNSDGPWGAHRGGVLAAPVVVL